jgi:hypothetical protein
MPNGRRPQIWRRGFLVALAATALLLVAPPLASAQGSPDATCPGPREGSYSHPGSGNNRFTQTFTPQISGALTNAEVEINKFGPSGDFIVQILETDGSGVPTNTILASTTIPDAAVAAGFSTVGVDFANPATVTAGQTYALVVTRPGGGLAVGVRQGDDCPGALFISLSQTGSFSQVGDLDLVFTVFVLDQSPPETLITKGPKDKTKKKTATFEFTGTDTRAISGFQCNLDAGAFAPCTSPYTVRVKKGKHTFQVQALDQTGNADGSPATDTWKRKKRRKKR